MNILDFIDKYKSELNKPVNNPNWDFERCENWAMSFKSRINHLLPEVKHSYLQSSQSFINQMNFKAINDLLVVHNLRLFCKKDALEILKLISETSAILSKIKNQNTMEKALNYLNVMLEMIFDDVLIDTTQNQLQNELILLSKNLDKVKFQDSNTYILKVKQKINQLANYIQP